MNIDSITNGIVIDHIVCGKAMKIFNMLSLDRLDTPVAVLKNVPSKKMGKKDIIKIDKVIDIDFDALGYVDSGVTVNVIKDGKLAKRQNIDIPEKI